MRFIKGFLLAVAVVVSIAVAAAATLFFVFPTEPAKKDPEMQDGVYNFLLAGVDGEETNADTLVVVSFDTTNQTLKLLSVPRDTMSNAPERSIKKINASYGEGGVNQTIKEVEMVTGLSIDRYAVTTFKGFEHAIDAIGGVDMTLPQDMYYSDPYQDLEIDLKAGPQHLDGKDALRFVRYRAGYVTGDLGRIEAQQLFFKALGEKLTSLDGLKGIAGLSDVLRDEMKTNLTASEMLFFAKKARGIDISQNVSLYTLPGTPEYVDELSYYIPSEQGILELLNAHFATGEKKFTADDLNLVDMARFTEASVGGDTKEKSVSNKASEGTQSNTSTSYQPSTSYQGSVSTPQPEPASPSTSVNEAPTEQTTPAPETGGSDYRGY